MNPVVRTEYIEVHKIGKVSYRSMHTVIKVGKRWLPIIARIIPGVSVPLLMGMNYKDGHAEDPDTHRKLGKLNTPKIFFFKDNKAPKPNVTVKRLANIHKDMEYADHVKMTMECNRLGCKPVKSMDLKI